MAIGRNEIKKELATVGIFINDIYDLVNSKEPYPAAIPVLIDLIDKDFEDIKEKEGVVRALAVKEAIGKANSKLIEEYNRVSKDLAFYRWAIGSTIYYTVTEDAVDGILLIVQNRDNGISRQMFVAALGKVKSYKAEDTLIMLLDDEDVLSQTIEALGRIKSKKAKEKIEMLSNHPKLLIKKEVQKALKRLT